VNVSLFRRKRWWCLGGRGGGGGGGGVAVVDGASCGGRDVDGGRSAGSSAAVKTTDVGLH